MSNQTDDLPEMGAPQEHQPPQLPAVGNGQSRFQMAMQRLILTGDLRSLTETERLQYYRHTCTRVGLDWTAKPFDLLVLKKKMVLYLNKSGAEQLNAIHGITHEILRFDVTEGMAICVVRATSKDGPKQESSGVVSIEELRGEEKANGFMKAETKAKRRATLSLIGLGVLDETEVETLDGEVISMEVTELSIDERLARAVEAFTQFEVTPAMIEAKAKKSLKDFDEADLDHLGEIFDALTEGEAVEALFPKPVDTSIANSAKNKSEAGNTAGNAAQTAAPASPSTKGNKTNPKSAPAEQTSSAPAENAPSATTGKTEEKKPGGGAKSANKSSSPQETVAKGAPSAAGSTTTGGPASVQLSDDLF